MAGNIQMMMISLQLKLLEGSYNCNHVRGEFISFWRGPIQHLKERQIQKENQTSATRQQLFLHYYNYLWYGFMTNNMRIVPCMRRRLLLLTLNLPRGEQENLERNNEHSASLVHESQIFTHLRNSIQRTTFPTWE